MVEACVGAGADSSCSYSNSFQVTVLPAPFGRPDLNPPGFQIVEVPASAAPTSGQSFEAQVDASTGSEIRSTPEWYLDNQLLQQGSTVNVSGLSPGRHKLEARFDSADGPVIVVREFDARLAPGSGFPWTSALLASLAGGTVGAAIVVGSSSRLRRPLVILLFASVYARLNRESLLDHFNRGSLHGIIKENPGIHFSDLRRRAGLSNGSAIHHLRALEQGGYIRVTSAGAFTRYFAMGQPVDAETYGLSPADSAVLRAVLNTPGIALADLAKGMGRSLGTTSRAVTRLSSLGFVSTERARRKRLVYPRQGGGTLPEAGTPGPSISED